MIECIFTLDYEIFGDGTGSLHELVFEPARGLATVFRKHNARFVAFVEAVELEKIEAFGTDPAIDKVQSQIREFYNDGFEIGLHLHPQWANARHMNGSWVLDYEEYNLCVLSRSRIERIVRSALDYLRHVVDDCLFTPISFRAGNWLFQPTKEAANVLWEEGLRIDSSVFKGGYQHQHHLDYRPALKNPLFWRFTDDVNQPDPVGRWLEIPIHSQMVPIWQMRTSTRMKQTRSIGLSRGSVGQKISRIRDFVRFRYPLKFDFCRMTFEEMSSMLLEAIREDESRPDEYRPLVAIGHTKDPLDLDCVDRFLTFLAERDINVTTFSRAYSKLSGTAGQMVPPAASVI